MPFIDTIAPSESRGEVREMYRRQESFWGYVPGYARIFSHRPEVLARWGRLLAEIRRPMDDRRFELVTFAAAIELRNTACALVHGQSLAGFIGNQAVQAIAAGSPCAALTETEAAIVPFARKVARDAAAVTAQDVGSLRCLGLSEAEIFDIVAAAAGRAFFTKMLDGLGVQADSAFLELDPQLRTALSVGRAISEAPSEFVSTSN